MSTPPPIDLSPFRILVDFLAGGYFALVSIIMQSGTTSVLHRIEFADPDIGNFGLAGDDWFLPAGSDPASAYGYLVMAGNNASTAFAALNLVNIGKTLADNPDEDRTHLELDCFFRQFTGSSRSGYMRCEVYRGPPMADVIAHLDPDAIFAALGTGVDTVRTAFQYRRDGHVGLLAEHEEAITVSTTEKRMRISIPVVGEDHTPTFQLL